MPKVPKITVSGSTGTGKTMLMVAIMDALRMHGFDVELVHDCEPDYQSFLSCCTDIDKRRKAMKARFKDGHPPIVLEEHNHGFSDRFGFDEKNKTFDQHHHIIEKVQHGIKD